VEQRHIDRIRNTKFPVVRRGGYDQREVDNFMLELADWLESRAADEIGSFAVKRKLEMVGRTTANILTTTQAEAEELRKTAEGEAAEVNERAEAAARKVRETAEDFATEVRQNAKRHAEEKVSAASEQARATVEEGQRRRAALETEIAELEALRERVLADAAGLGGELKAAVDAHRATATTPDLPDALGSSGKRRPRERPRRADGAAAEPERSSKP
jgi:DivIVA domain-containing protein